MRFISWNCQSGFGKKWRALAELQGDVAVVQEVTEKGLEQYRLESGNQSVTWDGVPGKKGIAIITSNGWTIGTRQGGTTENRHFLPVLIQRNGFEFILIAVWAMPQKDSHEGSYIGQVHDFVDANRALFSKSTILAGDFNASAIWDKERRLKTFTAVNKMLEDLGQHSAYHHHSKSIFGQEADKSFYLYRHLDRPYHIDYCYCGSGWLARLNRVEFLSNSPWAGNSDHRPLVCDFE